MRFDEEENEAGFPDLIEQGSLMGWACFLGFVGFLSWVFL